MATLLAVGILLSLNVVVPVGTAIILWVVAWLCFIAFLSLRRGVGGFVACCTFFVLLGVLRGQLGAVSLLPVEWQYQGSVVAVKCADALRSMGVTEESAGLLRAMLLGDRSGLDEGVVQLYRQAGAGHLLALSGLHLGLLFGLLQLLLLHWLTSGWRWFFGLFTLLLLAGYAFVTGFPISLCRASLMMSLLIVAQLRTSGSSSFHNLGVAAFVLLMINPQSLCDIGFQLSFMGVAGIFLFYQPLAALGLPRQPLFCWLWKALLVSLSAQAGVTPLVLHYFHSLSLTGLLLSPIYILLATTILYTALLLLLLHTLSITILSSLITNLLELLVDLQHGTMTFGSSLPLNRFENISFSWGCVVLSYAALFCLLPPIHALRQTRLEVPGRRRALFFRQWLFILSSLLLLVATAIMM